MYIVCIYNVMIYFILAIMLLLVWHSLSTLRLNFTTSIAIYLCHDSILGRCMPLCSLDVCCVLQMVPCVFV